MLGTILKDLEMIPEEIEIRRRIEIILSELKSDRILRGVLEPEKTQKKVKDYKLKLATILNTNNSFGNKISNPVGWGCIIHRMHLCRGVRSLPECLAYNTKQSDGETLIMLELWGMQSTTSLPLFLGSPWHGVVAPDRVLSMGQIEQFDI